MIQNEERIVEKDKANVNHKSHKAIHHHKKIACLELLHGNLLFDCWINNTSNKRRAAPIPIYTDIIIGCFIAIQIQTKYFVHCHQVLAA